MVNESQKNDKRFWRKWAKAGALGTIQGPVREQDYLDSQPIIRTLRDDRSGRDCLLSNEVYQITADDPSGIGSTRYRQGTKVRLISGVDGRYNTPGYHFRKDMVTVACLDAEKAEFIGVYKNHLELVRE